MHIAIVDPIFKASRLQYSHYVALQAQKLGMDIHIIARTDAYTELYDELFADIPHSLYEVAGLPDDFWFGKIPKSQIEKAPNNFVHISTLVNAVRYVTDDLKVFENKLIE